MGIDIYAHWKEQSDEAKARQSEAWLTIGAGGAGYLREAYHGEPYATKHLCAEAFETGKARISAAVMKERLPHTLALAEERERTLYKGTDEAVEEAKQSFRDFVALAERIDRRRRSVASRGLFARYGIPEAQSPSALHELDRDELVLDITDGL